MADENVNGGAGAGAGAAGVTGAQGGAGGNGAGANGGANVAKAEPKYTSASVIASTGGLIRTYDVETHGPKFAELAKEFSEHTLGSTITFNK